MEIKMLILVIRREFIVSKLIFDLNYFLLI